MRNTIVYFGIIQYDKHNAMCQHVTGLKSIAESLNYSFYTIGVSSVITRGSYKEEKNNIFLINDPQNIYDRICECMSASDIETVLNVIGLSRIKAFIMADFRCFPTIQLNKFCKKHGIHFIANIMDRFEAGKSLESKIKWIDSEFRIKKVYPAIKRRIYICSSYNYLIGTNETTAVIPGVITRRIPPSTKSIEENNIKKIVFLGNPGNYCEKEKIDWVLKALYELNCEETVQLVLAGFDKKAFLSFNHDLIKYITSSVRFMGKITHSDCIKLLSSSDFSLIIRPDTILSNYGFSTKIGEAFSCGVPVICTDTSDNSIYVKKGINGFICGCSYLEVKDTLRYALSLSKKDIQLLKNNILTSSILLYQNYIEDFKKVIE